MEPIHAMVWWVVVDCIYNMETDPNILCANITWIIVEVLKELGIVYKSGWDDSVPQNEDDCWDTIEHDDRDEKYTSSITCESPTKTHVEMVEIFTRKFGEGVARREGCHNWIHQGGLIVMVTDGDHVNFDIIVDYTKSVAPRTF